MRDFTIVSNTYNSTISGQSLIKIGSINDVKFNSIEMQNLININGIEVDTVNSILVHGFNCYGTSPTTIIKICLMLTDYYSVAYFKTIKLNKFTAMASPI